MEGIKIDKLILTEEDLGLYGILNNYNSLREQLYKFSGRKECILIQGAAFVVKGKAVFMACHPVGDSGKDADNAPKLFLPFRQLVAFS